MVMQSLRRNYPLVVLGGHQLHAVVQKVCLHLRKNSSIPWSGLKDFCYTTLAENFFLTIYSHTYIQKTGPNEVYQIEHEHGNCAGDHVEKIHFI